MRCPPISQHHRRGRRAGAEASRLINEAGHAPRIGAGNGALGQTTAQGSGARPAHWGRQRCIGAGNGPGIRGTRRALGQATVHWGRQRPGDPGHAPRIGAGNGALGQETAQGSGARPAHWGRKRPGDLGHAPRIGAGNGALGQANCLLQCLFSCPNAAHQTRGRTAAVVSSHGVRPKRRRRRPDQANGDHQRCRQTASNTRAVGAPFSQRYRDPRGRIRRAVPHSGSVFTAIPRFHSGTTLCKCYNTCKVTVSL